MGISEFSILLSCFNLLLFKFTGQNELAVKTNIDERLFSPENNHTVGCFINNIFIESIIDGKSCLLDLIRQVQSNTETAITYALPYEKLLKIDREKSIALSEIHFNLEPVEIKEDEYFQSQTYTHSGDVKNGLYFELDIKKDCILGRVEYKLSQYDESIIQSLIASYTHILSHFKSNIEKTIDEIDFLDVRSKNNIFHLWNDTGNYELNDTNILSLFEKQVEISPHNIAILYEKKSLTYLELNEKANQLANYILKNITITDEELICLYLDRSEYMIIAILAVLKSGAAYVPIDPQHPNERTKHILNDTKTKIIIANEVYDRKLKEISQDSHLILIDNESVQETLSYQQTALSQIKNGHLVYVLYTSGTTGKPKGVVLEQDGCVSRINYMIQQNELSEDDTVLFKTNYIFDVSFSDIFTTLLSGAKLVITKCVFDIDEIKYHLEFSRISICHFVPSQFQAIKHDLEFDKYQYLNKLMFSGENLFHKLLDELSYLNYTILNYYGPTETGEVTLNKFKLTDINNDDFITSNIGKPFNNIKCHILNDKLDPVPIGSVGELYIGGVGVAKGYLNNPELTNEKFIANPFNSINNNLNNTNIIYKTGDLVRWLSNGEIQYLGRNDSQVKIRGYRIELNEIENRLTNYPGIKQCVVLVNKPCFLIAYYVADAKFDEEKIRDYLARYLPDYMLPTVITYLEKFPLTTNGKLDKNKLPTYEYKPHKTEGAPRNELETRFILVLENILLLPKGVVGIRDDFFELGGDSIQAIQFISNIKKQFAINVSVKDLFIHKTIERLFENVLNKNQKSIITPIKTELDTLAGNLDFLPIQKWFFNLELNHINHWNQSFIIKTPLLDIKKLQSCIRELINHHDAFRLRYKKNQKGFQQYYKKNDKCIDIKRLDIRTLNLSENCKKFTEELENIFTHWQSEFNIETGPLYQIGYVYGYKDQSARIYFALHHLIIDSVSWRILLEDLQNLYQGKALSPKTSSYRQWVDAIKEYAINNPNELTYWETLLEDYNNRYHFPLKLSKHQETCHSEIVFTQENTSKLIKRCNARYNTKINDLLLTALGLSLSEITKSNTNYILLEGHGREEITDQLDITRTVGWFTTLFPVRLEVFKNDIGNSIKNIKETLALVPNKGIGFGELLGYGGANLPKITFNYLGQFSRPEDIDASVWNIVNESSGKFVSQKNKNYNDITINGLIIDGCLRFYVQSQLNKTLVDSLARSFKINLDTIIDHCCISDASQNTISDFQDFESYVTFNINKNKPKIFILPPGMGGAESYFNNLVPELKNNFNLILFNNFYAYLCLTKKISLQELEYVTFEFLASLYITYIKSIQPTGPYHFIGWSFGGVLSYEITRQLIAQGEIVENLFLLDPFFDYRLVIKRAIKNERHLINDINSKYNPPITNLDGVNIIFFKSQNEVKLSDLTLETNRNEATQRMKVMNYYAKHAKVNNLEKIITGSNINIINLKTTHIDLVETQKGIICSEIHKAFQLNTVQLDMRNHNEN
jgi:amino acid adenylation domain-containing protein/non-ribosomal peptide synthase protein (TIGR01720 family)